MNDLRFALRQLAKSPGFTTVALLSLALCIGANLTIFAVVDAILLRALPFPDAARLVTVVNGYPGAGVERSTASMANYFERRNALPAFASVAISREASVVVGTEGSSNRVPIAQVSPEFFSTLGVPLALGRGFTEDQLAYGADQVAVLTDGFWRSHFAADPAVLGRTFVNDGVAVTVIGVLPPGFRYLSNPAEFYRPCAHDPKERRPERRHSNNWNMIARLAPGATPAAAQAQIEAFNARQLTDDPLAQFIKEAGFHTTVRGLHADHVRAIKPTLVLLQAGGLLLLLIGVVNLASLLLIRASGRTRDLAVCRALGAGFRHVAAAVLVETTLLTFAGGGLGLLFGAYGIDLLRTLGTDRLPLGNSIACDARLMVVALVASVLLGFILAAPVLWFNLRACVAAGLHAGTRSGTATRAAQRLRHGFIVAQISLAFVLLASSGLLGLSLRRVLATPTGFTSDSILTGQIALPWRTYNGPAAQLAFAERLLPALRALPGVTQAAISTSLPFARQINDSIVAIEGRAVAPGQALHAHYAAWVSADYWSMLHIPLLCGRLLTDTDSHGPTRVCVVDQAFAERYWPGADPLGRRLALSDKIDDTNAVTIVGVVNAVKQQEVTEAAGHGAVYLPQTGHGFFSVLVHTALPAAVLAPAVRKAVLQLDPNLPIDDLRPLQSRIDDSLVARRSPAILAGLFAAVALLLATLGTYGVLAYAVSQRHREIGIRMALGALPRQVLAHFLGLGARLLLAGLALGLAGTWVAGLALKTLLFGVGSTHPGILAATSGVLLSVVFFALLIPAVRAARTSPMSALRAE